MPSVSWIVGGKSDGSVASNDHGGGYTDNYAGTWAQAQGDNGISVNDPSTWNDAQNACTITDSGQAFGGGTAVRITKPPGVSEFSDARAGMMAYIETNDATYADGRYEVLSATGPRVYLALEYVSDKTCDIHIGGALATLEAGKDLVVDGDATDVLVSQGEAVGAAVTFVDGGDKTDNTKWLRIRGVSNTDGTLLPAGEFITIDREDAGTDVIVWDDIDNVQMDAVCLTGGLGGAGLFINNAAAGYNYRITDCKLSGNKYGLYCINANVRNVFVEGSEFSVNTTYDIIDMTRRSTYKNCKVLSALNVQIYATYNSVFYGCLFIDGAQALYIPEAYHVDVIGCVFYNQTLACIKINHADASVVAYNNIFMPAATVDKSIEVANGSVLYADYNCRWSVAGGACASDTSGDNDIEADPMFANAASGDFRLKPESSLWNKGKRTLHDGYTTPGCWGRINRMYAEN